MRTLDSLHVQVEDVWLVWVGADRGISAVRQRAGLSVAEACDIVFVAAEVGLLLVVGCPYLECAEILVCTPVSLPVFGQILKTAHISLLMYCQTISSEAMVGDNDGVVMFQSLNRWRRWDGCSENELASPKGKKMVSIKSLSHRILACGFAIVGQ